MVEINRTAVHAALAESHRLAIADALAVEDLSPGELCVRTNQSSNLLAHHLAVLEQAGVVRSRRSDHDGRRTYFTLAWENPLVAATVTEGLALGATSPTGVRVVFVCSANSARSQFAASQLHAISPVNVASGGTEPAKAIHPLALAELTARGLAPLSVAPARASDVILPGDIVVAVCDHAHESLGREYVSLHWSVPDPANGGPGDFARAFDDLKARVARFADALT